MLVDDEALGLGLELLGSADTVVKVVEGHEEGLERRGRGGAGVHEAHLDLRVEALHQVDVAKVALHAVARRADARDAARHVGAVHVWHVVGRVCQHEVVQPVVASALVDAQEPKLVGLAEVRAHAA